jgi:phosphoglycolate phosphatase
VSPPPIRLVCFDMAGTTVKDDGAVEGAFLDALESSGVAASDPRRSSMLDYVRETMGTSKITVFRALFPKEPDAQAANLAFETAYDERVQRGDIEEMPGAVELIGDLRHAGVRVALLTGFSARTRDRIIKALGWGELADLLVSPEDAGRGRPFPDMVLCALMLLGIDDVAQVAVVGDTAADMVSGLRAGASMVAGVLSGADSEDRLRAAGATDILASVTELAPLLALRAGSSLDQETPDDVE